MKRENVHCFFKLLKGKKVLICARFKTIVIWSSGKTVFLYVNVHNTDFFSSKTFSANSNLITDLLGTGITYITYWYYLHELYSVHFFSKLQIVQITCFMVRNKSVKIVELLCLSCLYARKKKSNKNDISSSMCCRTGAEQNSIQLKHAVMEKRRSFPTWFVSTYSTIYCSLQFSL